MAHELFLCSHFAQLHLILGLYYAKDLDIIPLSKNYLLLYSVAMRSNTDKGLC